MNICCIILFFCFMNLFICYFFSSILLTSFISSFTLLSWAWASQRRQPLHLAGTSVCEVLLAGPISSGVDVVPFCSEEESYSSFPVDGVLVQWHFLKSQSITLCKFILSDTKNSWCLLGLNPDPRWKQFLRRTPYLWASPPQQSLTILAYYWITCANGALLF